MSKVQEWTAAFVLGAVVGGVTALLLAPEKGEVTRKQLKDGAMELAKRGEALAGEMRGAAAEAMDAASRATRKQVDTVRGAVTEAVRTSREKIERLRS